MHDISYRLKMIMGGLSERKFSERLDMAHTTVREYLKGRMPPADFIVRVCERFPDVDPWWLMTGQGKEPQKTASPVMGLIDKMLVDMDEEAQRDVLKYCEKTKCWTEMNTKTKRA